MTITREQPFFWFQVDLCRDRCRFHRAHGAPGGGHIGTVCFPIFAGQCVSAWACLTKESWCTETALAVDLSAKLGRWTWAELEVLLISMAKTFQREKNKTFSGTRQWVLQERTTLRMGTPFKGVERCSVQVHSFMRWKCNRSNQRAGLLEKAGEQIRWDSEVSYVLQLFSELQASRPLLNLCRNQARISDNLFMHLTDTFALGQWCLL